MKLDRDIVACALHGDADAIEMALDALHPLIEAEAQQYDPRDRERMVAIGRGEIRRRIPDYRCGTDPDLFSETMVMRAAGMMMLMSPGPA